MAMAMAVGRIKTSVETRKTQGKEWKVSSSSSPSRRVLRFDTQAAFSLFFPRISYHDTYALLKLIVWPLMMVTRLGHILS